MDLASQNERLRTALTIPKLAALLSISRQQGYALVQEGILPAIRIGGAIRLDPITVAAWLRSCNDAA